MDGKEHSLYEEQQKLDDLLALLLFSPHPLLLLLWKEVGKEVWRSDGGLRPRGLPRHEGLYP